MKSDSVKIAAEGKGEIIQPPDLEAFREWNRSEKPRSLKDKRKLIDPEHYFI